MARRQLTHEEKQLWGRVAKTVRPMSGKRWIEDALPEMELAQSVASPKQPKSARATSAPPSPAPRPVRRPADYLDDSWEKRIARGQMAPDHAIDLHGHTLDTAHRHFNTALAAAIHHGARVLLVVTGKPRPGIFMPGERARGAIRAEIGHWISSSPYADQIASVRNAHPRHGGDGALYVILRRRA